MEHDQSLPVSYRNIYKIIVDSAMVNEERRIDKVLSQALPHFSRTKIKTLILNGFLKINAAEIKDANYHVKEGDYIALQEPEPTPCQDLPEDIPLEVIYEDDHLMVINKQAGLVVHPAPGHFDGTLVNALLYHCGDSLQGVGDEKRPGIVHRLDKDTSGLMIVAKSEEAHKGLADQFAERTIKRTYGALVWGLMNPLEGRLESLIGRSRQDRQKMAVVTKNGKKAVTHYHTNRIFAEGAISEVFCTLETGRTHQIRVHLQWKGHSVVGDPLYGNPQKQHLKRLDEEVKNALQGFERQALHALKLEFIHPLTHQLMTFETPYPEDIQSLLSILSCES
jgi:23S rRNA pseudouridine1911/1915/1917 synthase